MHYNCQECTRLWNEYALATRHYLKVEGRLQMANISRDESAVEELAPVFRSAAAERARLRKEIEAHERQSLQRVGAARA
jgi:hypothetical protein